MRGVGGPLLCISDLLSDVREENVGESQDHAPPSAAADVSNLPASDLPKLFQENFNELKGAGALEGADHSWTALTLKLCTALETTNKLVDSADSPVASLAEKVEELGRIVDRRDSAIKAAERFSETPLQKSELGEMSEVALQRRRSVRSFMGFEYKECITYGLGLESAHELLGFIDGLHRL